MSGGHFEYKYSEIAYLGSRLEEDLVDNSEGFDTEVIERLRKLVKLLKVASELSRHAEWLYSGDYGEATFIETFDESIKKL